MMFTAAYYMQHCLNLAIKGRGLTLSNPMVGACIVLDGKIIGEGYHKKYGDAHAEVNAINAVQDKRLLKNATLYVSLEPCSHFGKTPPCADLIIESQIPRVVIGCIDPNAQVSGKGIKKLQEAGIEVKTGILEAECRALNEHFICYHEKKRPYILLKWAQSKDGFIAPEKGNRVMLSNELSQKRVHELRSVFMGILIGSNTAIIDDPQLNTRLVEGNNPVKILIDPELQVPPSARLLEGETPVLIFNKTVNKKEAHTEYISLNFEHPLTVPSQICDQLYNRNIVSVLVEGGKFTLENFLAAGVYDEINICHTPHDLLTGTKAPDFDTARNRLAKIEMLFMENDYWEIFKNEE